LCVIMNHIVFAIVVCAVCGVSMGSGLPPEAFNTEWTYNETYAQEKGMAAPSTWKDKWPYCNTVGGDTVQSPINIDRKTVVVETAGVLPLTFSSKQVRVQGKNIGASLSFKPDEKALSFQTASGRNYTFHEAHIHWHMHDDYDGTEHTVDGHGDFAEVQLVHYDSSFASLDEAVADGKVGNVAVMAIRFIIADVSLPDVIQEFNVFSSLRFAFNNTESAVATIDFYNLFARSVSKVDTPMFHYNGSLTTPTCNPIVSWFVIQNRMKVTAAQAAALRECLHVNKSCYEDGVIIDSNVRPVAPVNGRKIVAWPKIIDDKEPAKSSTSSSVAIWLSALAVIVAIAINIMM